MANQDLPKQTAPLTETKKPTKSIEQMRQFAAIVTAFDHANELTTGPKRKITSVEGKPSNHFRVAGVDVISRKDGKYLIEDNILTSGYVELNDAGSVLAHILAKENDGKKYFQDLKTGKDL
jgi:hypothetical protein